MDERFFHLTNSIHFDMFLLDVPRTDFVSDMFLNNFNALHRNYLNEIFALNVFISVLCLVQVLSLFP